MIDPRAVLGPGCEVGPYCVLGPLSQVGAGSLLHAHVVITGDVQIGPGAQIGAFTVLGGAPQDHAHRGEPGAVRIGADAVLREHVTVHGGSSEGGMLTTVGDRCILMVGSHVGHDGVLGDDCTLVNGVMLGGHVRLADGVFIGGGSQVHQFVRVGRNAHIGGGSSVIRDVPPWALVWGNRAALRGPNLVGMKRAGWTGGQLREARAVFAELFGPAGAAEPLATRVASLAQRSEGADQNSVVPALVSFLSAPSRRGVVGLPRRS